MMANTTNPEDSVEGTEIYSTEAVEDALLEESALENSDSLLIDQSHGRFIVRHGRSIRCFVKAAPNEARRSLWEVTSFKGENEEDWSCCQWYRGN